MAKPEGSPWTLERHERAPSLDRYGPIGRGVTEHHLLGAGPCRCGHPAADHLLDFGSSSGRYLMGPCVRWPEEHCVCRAYDPELPGELVEAYGR